jgi:hypothetical protein
MEDLYYFIQAGRQVESLFDDGDEDVNRDGDPDLSFDRVLGDAEEHFDTKMVLDPFEKQLDLPAATIKRRQGEVVGEEHQGFAGYGVLESDPTQRRVEVLFGVKASQHDGLIANQSAGKFKKI